MTLYVVCHKTLPEYSPEGDWRIIWLSAERPPPSPVEVVRGYDFFDNPERLHSVLAGSLGTLVMSKLAARGENGSPLVTSWPYSKFLSREPMGTPSANYPGMRMVTQEFVSSIRIPHPEMATADYMIVKPLKAGNILKQYARHHHLVDLLRFTTLALELGVLQHEEGLAFLHGEWLAPGGIELGTFPAKWWRATFEQMAAVSLAFVDRHTPHSADPYQRRAVSFCQERLGSYLLLKRLSAEFGPSLPDRLFGVMHTVAAGSEYRGGV